MKNLTNEQYTTFEQNLRSEIVNAAHALHKSGMSFALFADSKCNGDYWTRTSNGGWSRRASGGDSADAIRDIFANGYKYATECATAMEIVYYKALLEVFGQVGGDLFNRTFDSIYLMDWDIRDPLLRKVGYMEPVSELLIGDRAYFANPDHAPELVQWQGENVIVLEDGRYYGHGIGIADADRIINSLNSRRKSDNPRSAYLMNKAGRPDFKRLAVIMYSDGAVAVWKEFPPSVGKIGIEGKSGTVHLV